MGWTTFINSNKNNDKVYLIGTSKWVEAFNILKKIREATGHGRFLAMDFIGQNDQRPGDPGNPENDDFYGWEYLVRMYSDYFSNLPSKFELSKILLTDVKIIWHDEQIRKLEFINGNPVDVPDI